RIGVRGGEQRTGDRDFSLDAPLVGGEVAAGQAVVADAALVGVLRGQFQLRILAQGHGVLGFGVEDVDDIAAPVIDRTDGGIALGVVDTAGIHAALDLRTGVIGHRHELIAVALLDLVEIPGAPTPLPARRFAV